MIKLEADSLTPALKALSGLDRRRLMEATGQHLVNMATRAFSVADLRPSPWAPRKGKGAHALLRKTGTLWRSLRVITATDRSVVVGSDRKYAAIHQLGGVIPPCIIRPKKRQALYWPGAKHPVKSVKRRAVTIPPRPFFPVTSAGRLTPKAEAGIREIVRIRLRQASQK